MKMKEKIWCREPMIKLCSLLNLMVKKQLFHGGKQLSFPVLNPTIHVIETLDIIQLLAAWRVICFLSLQKISQQNHKVSTRLMIATRITFLY